jgi:excisionase family DNA binding protein
MIKATSTRSSARTTQESAGGITSGAPRHESTPTGPYWDFLLDDFAERVARKIVAQNGAHMEKRLLTLEEAATYLACTPNAIRHKVAQGKLEPTLIDRKLRFDIFDLDRYIKEGKA